MEIGLLRKLDHVKSAAGPNTNEKGFPVRNFRTQWKQYLLIALAAFSLPATAARIAHTAPPLIAPVSESEQLKGIVANLLQDNDEFVKSRNEAYFRPLAAGQSPRATVVTCSDSRVHTHALDKTPDGDLFMVRNIGNQISTAEGSVEYGVHHLHTPLLIIVGHSACGAIKAASGNYAKESKPIKRELNTIRIPKGIASMEGVLMNVNNQVGAALKKFGHEVKNGNLTVIGAIYDFSNELGRGYGKLSITNLNGETDAARIQANSLLAMTFKPASVGKPSAADQPVATDNPAPLPSKRSSPPAYSYP